MAEPKLLKEAIMERPRKIFIDGKAIDYIALQMTIDNDKDTGEILDKITVYDKNGGVVTVPIRRAEIA